MKRRTLLTGILVWILVVAVVSGVTWAVIDSAGDTLLAGDTQVGETQPPPPPPPASASASSPAGTSPQASRTTQPGPSGEPSGTSSPSRSPAAQPSSPTTTADSPRPGLTQSASGVERVWEGQPGLVAVRCEDARATLKSASPNNGYRVEVEKRGPEEIEVKFESASRELNVDARCANGVPRFDVEADDGE
ncbi:MAG: hypothetical protein ACXWDI_04295 [Nocardioides sp.]